MGPALRLTLPMLLLLQVLADTPDARHYALELGQATGLGTIYPLLAELEGAGWLASGWEDIDPTKEGRRPRRFYQLTTYGAEKVRILSASAQVSRKSWGSRLLPGPTTG
jgi:PadR family transcriptional regulator PadR